jgi:hypothetical protein
MQKIPSDLTFVASTGHRFTMDSEALKRYDLRGSWAGLCTMIDNAIGSKPKVIVCSPHTTPDPKRFVFHD